MIRSQGLTKRYGTITAVQDATFAVERGRVCALLGPNGSGKTTTLRMLLGLVRPTSGTSSIDGRLGAALDGFGFHPARSARDHLRMLGGRGEEAAVLEEVGLAGDADRAVGEYSLGMRQRLLVAQALLPDPGVLILDEPATGLDPDGIRWLRELLRARAAGGTTVLLSTHALAEAELIADAAVVLARGRVVAAGALEELGRAAVRVRSPRAEELARLLGLEPPPHDLLTVAGRPAHEVGELAHANGIPLHELAPVRSLEQIYLEATGT